MPPLITREEALHLGEIEDHAEIEALIDARLAGTPQPVLRLDGHVLAREREVGGCAKDCGFCAQSRFAEAETPMHAMMEPEQILEHARAAEDAGAHRFCMVTQGQGLSRRDFDKILAGARLVAEHTNLKRCASIGHMSPDRALKLKDAGIQRVHHNVETARSYYDEVSTTVRYEGRLRTISRRPGGRAWRHASAGSSTSVRRASSGSRWRSSSPRSSPTASRSTSSIRDRAPSSGTATSWIHGRRSSGSRSSA